MLNLVLVIGRLSRPAAVRTLPSGDDLLQLEVTVVPDEGKADTVPVVLADPTATQRALDTGDDVVVVGRIVRRFFRAGGATASRTEVVAEKVVRPRQVKQVARLLAEASATVDEHVPRGAAA